MDFREQRFQRWAAHAQRGLEGFYLLALVLAAAALLFFPLVAPGADVRGWLSRVYQELFLGLLAAIVVGGGLIYWTLKRIENEVKLDAFRRIDQLINQLDGREQLLAPELRRATRQLERFFADGIYVLHGRRNFQDFWLKAIRAHPGADILATSLPSTNFFWNAEDIHDATRINILAGGVVKRLFFLNQEEPTAHDLGVMNAQADLGVHVYYCNKNAFAPETREIALVDKALRFGWRVEVSTDDIQRADVMANRKELEGQYKRLEALFGRTELIKPLRGAPALAPPQP